MPTVEEKLITTLNDQFLFAHSASIITHELIKETLDLIKSLREDLESEKNRADMYFEIGLFFDENGKQWIETANELYTQNKDLKDELDLVLESSSNWAEDSKQWRLLYEEAVQKYKELEAQKNSEAQNITVNLSVDSKDALLHINKALEELRQQIPGLVRKETSRNSNKFGW